jgi:hypothetical protein
MVKHVQARTVGCQKQRTTKAVAFSGQIVNGARSSTPLGGSKYKTTITVLQARGTKAYKATNLHTTPILAHAFSHTSPP